MEDRIAPNVKDMIYDFLKEPTRERFSNVLFKGSGEQDNLDFKETWVQYQKISEIILGMANSGGGIIVIGVKENEDGTAETVGLEKLEDQEIIHGKIEKFLPSNLKFEIGSYDFDDVHYPALAQKKFQVIFIFSNEEDLPYVWNKDSNGAEVGCIFIRSGTRTIKANSDQIQKLIEKKMKASVLKFSKLQLEEHLNQLKILYDNIHKTNRIAAFPGITAAFERIMNIGITKNIYYPEEGYDEFVSKMIDKKKEKIEKILDLK